MSTSEIRFDDGAAYERYMGIWSQLAGEAFLQWIAPESGWRWLDVGCGNGAFTEMLIQKCDPASVEGIDPSEAQLRFARQRPGMENAHFRLGDAMALPFPDASFDAAVMPLVIFFVPQPARGVAEMRRVARPGGVIAAYAWDIPGGGFPYDVVWTELRDMGLTVALPPSPDASKIEVLQQLWADAGLEAVETRALNVRRTFPSFEDYWSTVLGGPSVGPTIKTMTPQQTDALKQRIHAKLNINSAGEVVCTARAHAAKGCSPRSAPAHS